MEARILGIADVYDSLTSTRPYRKGISSNEALVKLDEMIGTGQFDDDILHDFISMIKERVTN